MIWLAPINQPHAASFDMKTYVKKLKQQKEIARIRAERAKKYPYLKILSPKTASLMFQQGKLLLIDVNDKRTFEYNHILGAINAPNIYKVRLKLKKSARIGIYCKWDGEFLSAGAALHLMKQGYKYVYIIYNGLHGLKNAGLTYVEGKKVFKNGKPLLK